MKESKQQQSSNQKEKKTIRDGEQHTMINNSPRMLKQRKQMESLQAKPSSAPIQRVLLNQGTYPAEVYGVSNTKMGKKIANTLTLRGEVSGHFSISDQLKAKNKAFGDGLDAKKDDVDHIYTYSDGFYDENNTIKAADHKYEISDILSKYTIKVACVLQALINSGIVTEYSTAKEMHDDLWELNSVYRLYDLDTEYPKLYAARGASKTSQDGERLDEVIKTLSPGKYICVATGGGGAGHNFAIQVTEKTRNGNTYNIYRTIEDEGNLGGVGDDTKIQETWK